MCGLRVHLAAGQPVLRASPLITPLLVGIEALEEKAADIRAGMRLDDLPSLAHVRLVGLFREVMADPQLLARIQTEQIERRMDDG